MDISNLGTGKVTLAGQWKFHPGDDARWADPNFDDASWNQVRVPLSLQQQGYTDFSGYGWYRLTLHCGTRTAPPQLRFAVSALSHVSAFFANGVQFGQLGEFPPQARFYAWRPISFPIASSRWQKDRLVLAIRVWVDPKLAAWGSSGFDGSSRDDLFPPAIGSPAVIENMVEARKRDREFKRLPAILTRCAELVLALYLLGLYLAESRCPEYLWLGLNFAGDALLDFIDWIAQDTFLLSIYAFHFLNLLMTPLLFTTAVFGIWSAFNARVGRWLKVYLSFLFVYCMAYFAAMESGFLATWERYDYLHAVGFPLGVGILLAFLLRRAVISSGELRWFAISFVPPLIALLLRFAAGLIPAVSRLIDTDLIEILYATTNVFTVIAVGFLLMRRAGRARAEQDRLHAEMDAARQVQRLMLPAQSVDIPYVHIDTAYLPSQEVGGDFYQIAMGSDGSLLLIIGDVSGKGLHAALTMSLIVGLWQELVSCVESPREILRRFNNHLQSRLSGGFVTCLCARLKPDGQLTIANAGHLAPYWNGTEMTVLNGLPLGIAAESDYEESHHLLSAADTVIFLSDGVVEARDKSRSLFGFERLQRILQEHPGAEALASRAQQFGQEDDITVIAISPRAMKAQASTTQSAFAT